jgi:LCP family protein required for cell wall assembly
VLSVVLFLISAQTQDGVSPEAERALSSQGSLFTGSNILVLGSDVRTGESIDKSQSGPGRSDTIMLVHAAFGSVRKLSIPRDVEVSIPGHGINKINAAYALGGPALTIETVESFLGHGVKVSHLVEVDFKNFPDFIDSLGGVTVNNKSRICSPPFDNFWKGLHFKKGELHLNGTRALGYSRVRKNSCAPAEDDRTRAARQQAVLSAIGSQVKSPSTFFRLPWVSWNAPRTLRSDMNGLQLMMLFADMATGTSDNTEVLEATCCRGSNLFVSDGAKADAVRKLVEGN